MIKVSFQNSFHGRSLLNISLGSSEMHRSGFEPLMPGIKHGEFNNVSNLGSLITKKTAAVILTNNFGISQNAKKATQIIKKK
mgnify:CR=1 FL=1